MGVTLSEKERLFCRLVSFVEDESRRALDASEEISENYPSEVLERFKTAFGCAGAQLIVLPPYAAMEHDRKKEKALEVDEAKRRCGWNYVEYGPENKWEFSIGSPEMMSVQATTDGNIHLDWATAEEIFNFVSD